jgi:antitoxin PrlF
MRLHYYCCITQIEDKQMPQLPLQTESTLTDRYQTTVPSVVRKALHLGKKDKITFTVESNGSVTLSRSEQSDGDLALNAFLEFLGNDIQAHPENIQALTPDMKQTVDTLIQGVDIDLDVPLNDEDD